MNPSNKATNFPFTRTKNYPDRDLDSDLDQENFVPCKHSIWITRWIAM